MNAWNPPDSSPERAGHFGFAPPWPERAPRHEQADGLPGSTRSLSRLLRDSASTPVGHWQEHTAGPQHEPREGSPPPLSPLWQSFAQAESGLDGNALEDLHAQLLREVQDNGITYNVYADSEDPKRPWALDVFPVMLHAREWAGITAGVQQRMRLLEAIMADAYGEQHLVAQGVLPAALVQGHPGFLSAMQGCTPVGGQHLHMAAFDLARGPDGHWWLLSQRTQAPSGLGYLLENRALIARLFPRAFAALGVQRLAPTYAAWLAGIRARCAVAPGETPHLALLTPGPYNETYFEHAYLARQLGMSLVQADDLSVRSHGVFLKTLHGLQRVHAILKRVDDLWLDPLELRADSSLGVPGLLQAVRAGQVLLVNPPGSGFLESNALLGFMPALAEKLLGEPLRLPAIPSWWCGEAAAWADAQAQLADGVIKPSYPSGQHAHSFEPVLGHQLTPEECAQWLLDIAQDPEAHTIQRRLPLSHQAVWRPSDAGTGQVQTRPLVLRVFALRDAQDEIHVLPGGLARLGTREGIASMQRGGSSADVWVAADATTDAPEAQPEPGITCPAPEGAAAQTPPNAQVSGVAASLPPPGQLQRPDGPALAQAVTSRAAENLHWLGRYTERSELCLRLTHTALTLADDGSTAPALRAWLETLGLNLGLFRPNDLHDVGLRHSPQLWLRHLWDARHCTGLAFNLAALHRAAGTVRERLSVSHWQWLDELAAPYVQGKIVPLTRTAQALRVLSQTNHRLAAITGAQTDRMSRDDGWRLLSLGRHLERLDFQGLALHEALAQSVWQDPQGFDALLALSDGHIAFHARFAQQRNLMTLIDFLVCDGDQPRAVAWIAKTLHARLRRLEHLADGATRDLAQRLPAAQPAPSALAALPQDTHPLMHWLTQQRQASSDVAGQLNALFFTHGHDRVRSVGN